MNKKGFSLVELLAVIVILSLLTIIGVSSFRSISENVKETAYKNKVSLIETKAVEYANSIGFLVTNVDQLVKEGFLDADDEAGHVVDPRDSKEYLNCHVVSMTSENNIIYASYSEDYTECDANNLDRVNRFLEIQIFKDGTSEQVESGTWIKENARLVAHFKIDIDTDKITKIEWSNATGFKEEYTNFNTGQSIVINNVDRILESDYYVSIIMENGRVYQAKALVKIDKANPTIVQITNESTDSISKSKNVKVRAADVGSGVAGYAITKEKRKCTEVDYTNVEADEYSKEITENGTYYVCVKDKVGNVTEEAKSFKVEGIDNKAPSCELEVVGTMGANGWYTSDIEIRFKTMNDDSGIATSFIDKKTIDYDTGGEEVAGTVIDNAGNIGKCSIQVKVDKTSPTCELEASGTKGAYGWYISNVNIYFKNQSDVMSGVASGSLSRNQITENNYAPGVEVIGTVVDGAGNSGTCSIKVKKDSQAPKISPIENPKTLGTDDYLFSENVDTDCGTSGRMVVIDCPSGVIGGVGACKVNERGISCTPIESQKTGIYNVSCTLTCGNGMESEPVTFEVKHSYKAHTSNWSCGRCGAWIPNQVEYCCGSCGTICCEGDVVCGLTDKPICDWTYCDYDYDCDKGGRLEGDTCYFD